MTHAIRFLFTGIKHRDEPVILLPKPRLCIHRPSHAAAVYYFKRADGAPVTDADLDEVARCDTCYPVGQGKMIDNRKTS